MNVLKLVRILPLAVSSESNLPFCVLLIEATLELKLPIEELNPLVVVSILELKYPIEDVNDELKLVIVLVNPLVVVATDEDKLPILELNPLVVVATLELNESMLELNPLVVVATDEDNEPILVDILELNVEYPVVLVKSTWTEPDINPLGLFAMLSQVVCVIDPLNT